MLISVGLVIFMLGIYFSTLLTTGWIITGTLMAVIGGGIMGISTYFLSKTKKNNYI